MPNAIACARKVTNTAGVSQRLYYDGSLAIAHTY
jgi:hypothetical protein